MAKEKDYEPGERFMFDPDDFVFYDSLEEMRAGEERERDRRAKRRARDEQ